MGSNVLFCDGCVEWQAVTPSPVDESTLQLYKPRSIACYKGPMVGNILTVPFEPFHYLRDVRGISKTDYFHYYWMFHFYLFRYESKTSSPKWSPYTPSFVFMKFLLSKPIPIPFPYNSHITNPPFPVLLPPTGV